MTARLLITFIFLFILHTHTHTPTLSHTPKKTQQHIDSTHPPPFTHSPNKTHTPKPIEPIEHHQAQPKINLHTPPPTSFISFGQTLVCKQTPQLNANRKFVVGGNWKCNGTKQSTTHIVNFLNTHSPTLSQTDEVEVVIAPPALHTSYTMDNLNSPYKLALQNVGLNSGFGAYTGEISSQMIKDFGLEWAIIGHSERRAGFGGEFESDELVAKKTKSAIDSGLKVILCIGEKLEERENGETMKVLSKQLDEVRKELTHTQWENVVIAYEPVWAIGTGKSATPQMAQDTHKEIRNWMENNLGEKIANETRILYGGSVKGNNAKDLISESDIDGFLVGGASLTEDFIAIMQSTENAVKRHVVHQ